MYTLFDAGPVFYQVPGTIKELAPLVKKYGIGGIAPTEELLEDENAATEARKLLDDLGLKWGLLPMPMDSYWENTTDEMFREGLAKLQIWAKNAEKMGVTLAYNHIFPGSNVREFQENFEWHINRITQVYNILSAYGIHYGLEFLGPWDLFCSFRNPFMRTIAGVLSLADSISNEIGFLFDTFHWSCMGARREDLMYAAVHNDRMVCFHINDGIAGRKMFEQKDLTRAMPMTTGVIDSVTPWKLFRDYGYDGPVLCEPIKPTYERFAKMSPEEVVSEIAEAYRRMETLASQS
ncbi:TIM barrel protein [Clostridium sp. Marseille-P3244]|uniref:TIM barrel protein n=1 Tax=Clostridium sp. Marseille-P3244 TaxID=1871020 RepID=UPI000930B063|nr:TIM barrel protein [Clostridium sp. Marseille-P3244]